MLRAALLTAVIEVGFFFLLGYRDRLFLLYWALVNLFTNLLLNLSLRLLPLAGAGRDTVRLLACPAELLVVLAEWALLLLFLGRGKKLLLFSFISNLLSFLIGLLLQA